MWNCCHIHTSSKLAPLNYGWIILLSAPRFRLSLCIRSFLSSLSKQSDPGTLTSQTWASEWVIEKYFQVLRSLTCSLSMTRTTPSPSVCTSVWSGWSLAWTSAWSCGVRRMWPGRMFCYQVRFRSWSLMSNWFTIWKLK